MEICQNIHKFSDNLVQEDSNAGTKSLQFPTENYFSSREVMVEPLLEKSKSLVMEKSESENVDVLIDNNFGTSGHELEAENKNAKGSVRGWLTATASQKRKNCGLTCS